MIATKNGQAFLPSQRREFQCQDIKLATLNALWKDPDHFVLYATYLHTTNIESLIYSIYEISVVCYQQLEG